MNKASKNDASNNRQFISGVVEGFYGRPWSCDQRKELFQRLREFKLNSYMYAPKDDTKHRAKWRKLYNEQEADELRSLISAAKANGIDFYYSLAPGLDMVYSDKEELNLLRKKYDQLVELGCESFAILFDDIEPRLCQKDKDSFENYPSAQVYVANTIFEYLEKPKFLFCPTEYCESRAVPDVPSSIYLNSIGSGLSEGIDIMWSGPRVVSRLITEESIEILTKIIRRPPVIWENLHANDYDKKRVFLGPYSGRSTKIIPKLRGVLTNPNCEYEANYLAIHTLAQWTRCSGDINLHNRCDPDVLVHEKHQVDDSVYDPHRALELAIKDWLPHFFKSTPMPIGIDLVMCRRDNDQAIIQLTKEATSVASKCSDEAVVDMSPDATPSSTASTVTGKSVMDTSSPPAAQNDTNSCDSCEMQIVNDQTASKKCMDIIDTNNSAQKPINVDTNSTTTCIDCEMSTADNSESLTTATQHIQCNPAVDRLQINYDSILLLVDLFYLPFQHGPIGTSLLNEFRWLRNNHDSLIHSQKEMDTKTATEFEVTSEREGGDIVGGKELSHLDWIAKANRMDDLCARISDLVNNLILNCPNKLLMLELYPYLADMRFISDKIRNYLKDLRSGYRTCHRLEPQAIFLKQSQSLTKDAMTCEDEQEPWVHRGGLSSDVQKLIAGKLFGE